MNAFVAAYLKARGYEPNTTALDIIEKAAVWYRIGKTQEHLRPSANGLTLEMPRMGFAKRAAADDANLCEIIEINAGKNNSCVQELLKENQFQTQFRRQLEIVSAEGTAACYVWLDGGDALNDGTISGGRIRLNYVDAAGVLPLTIENNEIVEAAFWGTHHRGTREETALVIFTRDGERYLCESIVFDDQGHHEQAQIVRLGSVKPFAVMRNAEVNSIEGMDGYGFPKVYASIPLFLNLDAAFNSFFGDIEKSDTITFLNEQLVDFDDNGTPQEARYKGEDKIGIAQRKRFVFLGEALPDAKTLIHNEQPTVRVEQFRQAIELMLDMLSMKFGFGTKRYSFKDGQVTTATEYIGERQDMMQELNKQRQEAVQYIEGIIRAALWFRDRSKPNAGRSAEKITIEFDDSYIENKAEKLESLRQDALSGIGGMHTRALYLKTMYNLTDAEAALWASADADAEPPEGGA